MSKPERDGIVEYPDEVYEKIAANVHGLDAERDEITVIDSNGSKYAVGWDDDGWFNIYNVTIEEAGGEFYVEGVGEYPITGFNRRNIDALLSAIEGGR